MPKLLYLGLFLTGISNVSALNTSEIVGISLVAVGVLIIVAVSVFGVIYCRSRRLNRIDHEVAEERRKSLVPQSAATVMSKQFLSVSALSSQKPPESETQKSQVFMTGLEYKLLTDEDARSSAGSSIAPHRDTATDHHPHHHENPTNSNKADITREEEAENMTITLSDETTVHGPDAQPTELSEADRIAMREYY